MIKRPKQGIISYYSVFIVSDFLLTRRDRNAARASDLSSVGRVDVVRDSRISRVTAQASRLLLQLAAARRRRRITGVDRRGAWA